MFLPKAEKKPTNLILLFLCSVLTNFKSHSHLRLSLPAAAQPRSRRRASGILDNSHVNLKAISAKFRARFLLLGPHCGCKSLQ